MSNKKGILIGMILVSIFFLGSVGQALAVTTLPDPNDIINPGASPVETIASQHDDFYAYSLDLNTQLGLSGYNLSHRQGLTIYGDGSETNNSGIGAGGAFTFPDGLNAPGGSASSFTSGNTWGDGVTVDSLLSYMHATYGAQINTPVFIFNNNQTGSSPNIFLAGKVSVVDPNNNDAEIKAWAFDQDGYPNVSNHTFEVPTADGTGNPPWVVGLGNLVIPDVNYNGVTGTLNISNNIGHNDCEFLGIAPGMDLSQYAGLGYEFRATFYLDGLNNGYDSLYMNGAFALPTPPPAPVVPEPASMMLLGLGLAGVARKFRRK